MKFKDTTNDTNALNSNQLTFMTEKGKDFKKWAEVNKYLPASKLGTKEWTYEAGDVESFLGRWLYSTYLYDPSWNVSFLVNNILTKYNNHKDPHEIVAINLNIAMGTSPLELVPSLFRIEMFLNFPVESLPAVINLGHMNFTEQDCMWNIEKGIVTSTGYSYPIQEFVDLCNKNLVSTKAEEDEDHKVTEKHLKMKKLKAKAKKKPKFVPTSSLLNNSYPPKSAVEEAAMSHKYIPTEEVPGMHGDVPAIDKYIAAMEAYGNPDAQPAVIVKEEDLGQHKNHQTVVFCLSNNATDPYHKERMARFVTSLNTNQTIKSDILTVRPDGEFTLGLSFQGEPADSIKYTNLKKWCSKGGWGQFIVVDAGQVLS